MKEILVEVVRRLDKVPEKASELVRLRAETSELLHKQLDLAKQCEIQLAGQIAAEKGADGKPSFPNEAARAAELQRRLKEAPDWTLTQRNIEQYRRSLRELDAEIESVQRRHRSDVAIISLVTALIGAGMTADAETVLRAYAGQTEAATPAAEQTADPQEDIETLVAKVLEVRQTKTDTIRAYCEVPEKGKIAVYAKSSTGNALKEALGREVTIKAKKLDKGYFAVKVA